MDSGAAAHLLARVLAALLSCWVRGFADVGFTDLKLNLNFSFSCSFVT